MRKKSLWFLGIAALMALAVFTGTCCPVDLGSGEPSATGDSSVTGVTVTPKAALVAPGKTQQFTATVEVSGDAAKTVTWKVEGTGKKDGTAIDTTGKLTVAADETASPLTVTATSTVDTGKSGPAAVTVRSSADPVESITIIIGFAGDITVTGGTETNTISKSGADGTPKTLNLSAEGYTTPTWYVNGAETGTGGASITLDASTLEVRPIPPKK